MISKRRVLAAALVASSLAISCARAQPSAIPQPIAGRDPQQSAVRQPIAGQHVGQQVPKPKDVAKESLPDFLPRAVSASSVTPTGEKNTYTPDEQRAFNAWVLDYRKHAYGWQAVSTRIIFWVVMFVVVSGVALAAWQLATWMRRVKAYDAVFLQRLQKGDTVEGQTVVSVGQAGSSEVALKTDALTLSSPYVGVTILGLSMGFFIAYLLFVYPVIQGP